MTLEPAVSAGKPDNETGYEKVDTDGFSVYVTKKARISPSGVKIDLYNFLGYQQIVLRGLSG